MMETDLQKNWDEAIKDKIQVHTATVIATSTVIWSTAVPAGTKRRILRIIVTNDSAGTPRKCILRTKSAAGVANNIWNNRYIPAAGFVEQETPQWRAPLVSLEPGGNFYAGGATGFDGFIEITFYDDFLGLS